MSEPETGTSRKGLIRRTWSAVSRPSVRYSLGTLFVGGIVVGVLGWGAFNWSMELSNTESFCVSCHEMRNTVYKELQETVHFTNRTGVRATCSDCHVPKEWHYKLIRKVQATNELFHKVIGTIDTPEKFEAQRLGDGQSRMGVDESDRFTRMSQLSFKDVDGRHQTKSPGAAHAWAGRAKEDKPASSAIKALHTTCRLDGMSEQTSRKLGTQSSPESSVAVSLHMECTATGARSAARHLVERPAPRTSHVSQGH